MDTTVGVNVAVGVGVNSDADVLGLTVTAGEFFGIASDGFSVATGVLVETASITV